MSRALAGLGDGGRVPWPASSPPRVVGRLADRFGAWTVVVLGLLIAALLLLPQAIVTNTWQLLVPALPDGVGAGRAAARDHRADPLQRAGSGRWARCSAIRNRRNSPARSSAR